MPATSWGTFRLAKNSADVSTTDAIPLVQRDTVYLRELLSGSFIEIGNFNGSVALRIFCILGFTQQQPVADAEEFALFG